MRIQGPIGTATVATPTPSQARRASAGAFALNETADIRAASTPAALRTLGGIDALIALQGIEDPIERLMAIHESSDVGKKLTGTIKAAVPMDYPSFGTPWFMSGLASLSPQSAVVMEQEKVNGEVWMPSYAEANLAARVFLLAKFSFNVVTRYSDYKKVQVASDYDLSKPKEDKKPEKQP